MPNERLFWEATIPLGTKTALLKAFTAIIETGTNIQCAYSMYPSVPLRSKSVFMLVKLTESVSKEEFELKSGMELRVPAEPATK